MAKHKIVGRLGPADTEPVLAAPNEHVTDLQLASSDQRLLNGVGHAVHDLENLGIQPSPEALELYSLAVLVYAADTRISRLTESEDDWTREICIVLPVRDQATWLPVKPKLEEMLAFLTGDIWTVEFRSHTIEQAPASQTSLIESGKLVEYTSVSLFSGGLDSLIGAIDQLATDERPLLVSHAGEGAISEAQHKCFEGLKSEFPQATFNWLRVWLQFDKNLFPEIAGENTTRARSFLFLAAGALTASGLDSQTTIRVPENGFIALNIPLDSNRLGALSTRTTHPYYLARWQELVKELGIRADIQNPFWNKTKGEMVKACKNIPVLYDLLPSSMSCSSPTKGRWRGHGVEHCGYCLPCLIRRAALLTGLKPEREDPSKYTLEDLSQETLDTRKSEGVQARSTQIAIERLKQNPMLAQVLIHKTGSLADVAEDWDQLAEVYRRGLMEVGELLEDVVTMPL